MNEETVDDYVLKALKTNTAQAAGWQAWPGLRHEFSTFEEFQAYCVALRQGRLARFVGTCENYFVNDSPRTML